MSFTSSTSPGKMHTARRVFPQAGASHLTAAMSVRPEVPEPADHPASASRRRAVPSPERSGASSLAEILSQQPNLNIRQFRHSLSVADSDRDGSLSRTDFHRVLLDLGIDCFARESLAASTPELIAIAPLLERIEGIRSVCFNNTSPSSGNPDFAMQSTFSSIDNIGNHGRPTSPQRLLASSSSSSSSSAAAVTPLSSASPKSMSSAALSPSANASSPTNGDYPLHTRPGSPTRALAMSNNAKAVLNYHAPDGQSEPISTITSKRNSADVPWSHKFATAQRIMIEQGSLGSRSLHNNATLSAASPIAHDTIPNAASIPVRNQQGNASSVPLPGPSQARPAPAIRHTARNTIW
ncbi:putative mitochondrial protein [Andalucia godoyi]|uniref:Putative mitochondrial protein n=1 Tax=Andalucia godoyi TaxID=505711 RepID=A0A8K0AHW5_ANDGO|nr:putative mitochondrial protein [Andalucia godoyi]|eukprot:ANDGO_08209.mRNA.1 putative mitochondrial protein